MNTKMFNGMPKEDYARAVAAVTLIPKHCTFPSKEARARIIKRIMRRVFVRSYQ